MVSPAAETFLYLNSFEKGGSEEGDTPLNNYCVPMELCREISRSPDSRPEPEYSIPRD